VPPPTDANATAPGASIDAIACGATGSCGAAGTYADAGGTPRTMVASQTAGSWGAATRLALPADADPADARRHARAGHDGTVRGAATDRRPQDVEVHGLEGRDQGQARLPDRACSGTVKLTTTAKRKTVVLAKASYALVRGRTATISVRLTKAGRKALKHSRARAVRAKLVISLKGARTISKTVAIR
jgi:hypothetical protein